MNHDQRSTWYCFMSLTRSKDTEQSVQKRAQSSPSIASLRPYLRAARRTENKQQRLFTYGDSLQPIPLINSALKDWTMSFKNTKMANGMWKTTIHVSLFEHLVQNYTQELLMRLKSAVMTSKVCTDHFNSSKKDNGHLNVLAITYRFRICSWWGWSTVIWKKGDEKQDRPLLRCNIQTNAEVMCAKLMAL